MLVQYVSTKCTSGAVTNNSGHLPTYFSKSWIVYNFIYIPNLQFKFPYYRKLIKCVGSDQKLN